MLVSDWVDGIDFAEVGQQPDPVRDRYAEIIYRFFYGAARELDLALGDPHPGNYLLCDDGRVAFLDFGMLRDLPRGYLDREAVILAAIRDRRRADAARRDARARATSAKTRLGRLAVARPHARGVVVARRPTGPCGWRPRTSGAAARPCVMTATGSYGSRFAA